ncbi:MAG: glutathione transferase GstA [Alphaproteobacteria bacterium]|nr:glutathione transferase GstA [Alphaproteobacteria bacterium]
MELFYAPLACSLASHIVCREAEIPILRRRVNLATKEIAGGGSLYDVNPKGAVPTLRRDDGSILTEGSSVLQYLGDLRPESTLCPPAGSDARYRTIEWLSFIATEMHKRVFYMMFTPDSDAAAKQTARAAAPAKLAIVARGLAGQEWLAGGRFTVADAYLFWWLTLAQRVGIAIADHNGVEAYHARCAARPAVREALAIEMSEAAA